MVRSQARKSTTLSELVRKLAPEIPDDKARAAFIRKYGAEDHATSASGHAPRVPSQPHPSQPGAPLDAAALARAESDLAGYVGALARVLVRRAAAQARTLPELYHLLAEHVEDPADRKAFVRKGLSISGRLPS